MGSVSQSRNSSLRSYLGQRRMVKDRGDNMMNWHHLGGRWGMALPQQSHATRAFATFSRHLDCRQQRLLDILIAPLGLGAVL